MSTVAQRISGGVLVVDSVDDAIRQEAAQMRSLWQEFGWGGLDDPGPQSEGSIERGFRLRGPVEEEWPIG